MSLTSCDDEPLASGADHRLIALTDSRLGLRVDAVTLGDLAAPAAGRREVSQTLAWGPAERRLAVTAGPETYLAVRENANPGWEATLSGRPLRSVRLDGWQQGFVLPAGAAGTVELVYAPDRLFRAGLVAGALAALLLLGLALVRGRRAPRPAAEPVVSGRALAGAGAVVVVLLGGLAALPALALGVAVRRGRWLPVLGGVLLVLAGALVALAPWGGTRPPGADALLPQLLALAAVATLPSALLGASREPAVDGEQ